jgi:hypothetical protein
MKGYDVRTIDGDKVGHVLDVDGDFLIVEHGLLKTKHALPRTFAEIDEAEHVVRTTLAKNLIYDSPKVNDHLDRAAVAEHYGLAEGFTDPPTRAGAADESFREHVHARKEVAAGHGPLDKPAASRGAGGTGRRH